jgi:HSP20 family protein
MKSLNYSLLAFILIILSSASAHAENTKDTKFASPAPSATAVANSATPLFDTNSFADSESGDPFQEVEKVQDNLNKVFRESYKRMKNYQQAGKFFEPDADFIEQPAQYILKVDLPGMQKDQISMETTDNKITISGERKTERQYQSEKDGVKQFERSSGSFYRQIALPADADSKGIAAKYNNGVLEVTIPKLQPQTVEKKKVQIQ